MISLTQATESGTIYRVEEIQALAQLAEKYRIHVHMDGARFANAIASAGVSPKAMTWQAGVDVLCFGGTKNGMAVGEAVVFFNRKFSEEFEFRCKQSGQLVSKMRFLAASWAAVRDGCVRGRHPTLTSRPWSVICARLPGWVRHSPYLKSP